MNNLQIKLAPSILAADGANLGQEIKKVSDAGCEYIHIDIMDGHFVPNLTFGPHVIKSLRKYSDKIFDVHLMVDNPMEYIEPFVDAGADIITVHVESTKHLHKVIQGIKEKGVKVGVSLNPATSYTTIEPIIKDIDMVLIMSVNPGFGGQSFIESSLDKISKTRELLDKYNPNCDIQVDGGINLNNVKEVVKSGANILVAGSAIFNADDVAERINEFKSLIGE